VHAVQAARREAGLDVSDRIVLRLDGDAELVGAARRHEPYIAGEVLATEVRYESSPNGGAPVTIDGRELHAGVTRA
jgi:isoleucyl-tRNA synthetase